MGNIINIVLAITTIVAAVASIGVIRLKEAGRKAWLYSTMIRMIISISAAAFLVIATVGVAGIGILTGQEVPTFMLLLIVVPNILNIAGWFILTRSYVRNQFS